MSETTETVDEMMARLERQYGARIPPELIVWPASMSPAPTWNDLAYALRMGATVLGRDASPKAVAEFAISLLVLGRQKDDKESE